jgi:hypothetical protein
MSGKDTKVLGYVAVKPGTINVLCDGDACIVAGSEKKMNEYIKTLSVDRNAKYQISKARYGHVLKAMKLGGVYSFDQESYSRFYPLACEDGIELVDFTPDNQERPNGTAISLMRVQWISKQ